MKILFAWDMDSSAPSGKKTGFYRKVYGYTQKRNGKEYRYEGVVDPSERINDSVVEVPESKAGKVSELLDEYGEIFNDWIRRKVIEK